MNERGRKKKKNDDGQWVSLGSFMNEIDIIILKR